MLVQLLLGICIVDIILRHFHCYWGRLLALIGSHYTESKSAILSSSNLTMNLCKVNEEDFKYLLMVMCSMLLNIHFPYER